MKKIPVYFNYIGKYPELLDAAVKSIPERFEVIINYEENILPLTKCLNNILRKTQSDVWFFMHYDAEIIDDKIFDIMIEKYLEKKNNTASVCACDITDLLMLIDTEKVRKMGGWDENFKNSFMEIDFRCNVFANGYIQPIIYSLPCPPEMLHKESSKLRQKNDRHNNVYHIYMETLKSDFLYFRKKYPKMDYDKNLYRRVMEGTWSDYFFDETNMSEKDIITFINNECEKNNITLPDDKIVFYIKNMKNKNLSFDKVGEYISYLKIDISKDTCRNFITLLINKYLNRMPNSDEEVNFHASEILEKIKTFEEKEIEFLNCEERNLLIR